jgi:hypothetical protein
MTVERVLWQSFGGDSLRRFIDGFSSALKDTDAVRTKFRDVRFEEDEAKTIFDTCADIFDLHICQ